MQEVPDIQQGGQMDMGGKAENVSKGWGFMIPRRRRRSQAPSDLKLISINSSPRVPLAPKARWWKEDTRCLGQVILGASLTPDMLDFHQTCITLAVLKSLISQRSHHCNPLPQSSQSRFGYHGSSTTHQEGKRIYSGHGRLPKAEHRKTKDAETITLIFFNLWFC